MPKGWSRQLRLTPLKPVAYIVVKVLTATLVGLASITAVYLAGGITGAHMPVSVWVETVLIAWIGSLVFAAFGLFMGYLLPSENLMQILGPVLALLAFLGGLFIPLDQLGEPFRTLAKFTPMYGLNQLVHAPLMHHGLTWGGIINLVLWAAMFVAGAAWRFRRDTACDRNDRPTGGGGARPTANAEAPISTGRVRRPHTAGPAHFREASR